MSLDNTTGIFETKFRVNFKHTGLNGEITNKHFLNFMEDAAGEHSAFCHYTFKDLADEKLSWVIIGWKLKVLKRFTADEDLIIHTWPRKIAKAYTIRDMEVYNEKGELCALSSSKWCIVNIETGKIVRISATKVQENFDCSNETSVFEIDDLPKLTVPDSEPIAEDSYTIRRFDLDNNKHVHNLNYLDFAYEVIPEDIYYSKEYPNLEILYRTEIKYGQTVKSVLYKDEEGYTIAIKSEDESIVHAIIKLY